jgi:hypothetical protein
MGAVFRFFFFVRSLVQNCGLLGMCYWHLVVQNQWNDEMCMQFKRQAMCLWSSFFAFVFFALSMWFCVPSFCVVYRVLLCSDKAARFCALEAEALLFVDDALIVENMVS